jgi:hypothetical protein
VAETFPKKLSAVESLFMAQAAGAAAVETTSSKVKNPTETKQNFSDSSSFDSYTSKVKIQMKKLSEQF